MRAFILLFLCFGLTACVNLKPKPDTVRLYVLGPLDTAVESGVLSGPAIYIARPDLPTYVDGTRLQYRRQGGELRSLSGARWAEPLQEGVSRALSEYLSSQHAINGYYPWPKLSSVTSQVRVRFSQFGATADGQIQLSAHWQIEGPEAVVREGVFAAADLKWQTDDAQSMVAGLNEALQALAADISNSL
jgi:uncharacterized lipoprotein YmbA